MGDGRTARAASRGAGISSRSHLDYLAKATGSTRTFNRVLCQNEDCDAGAKATGLWQAMWFIDRLRKQCLRICGRNTPSGRAPALTSGQLLRRPGGRGAGASSSRGRHEGDAGLEDEHSERKQLVGRVREVEAVDSQTGVDWSGIRTWYRRIWLAAHEW